jgi:hypothetical protein
VSWCECAGCHEVFSSLTGFDAHQKRAFGTPAPVTCLEPSGLGMHRNRHGHWAQPGQDAPSGLHRQNLRAFHPEGDL